MIRIEVDKDELVKYLYRHCPAYFYNYAEGECCRRKVDKSVCSLHAFSEELHCPLDCPRLTAKEYACDKGKCPKIKALIKKLKN
ncbi:MAG: hypothetical protein NC311_07570 [Muribaculaceae bacterium]|nr:hypothetical protein [Muribaculaceae bacterium]